MSNRTKEELFEIVRDYYDKELTELNAINERWKDKPAVGDPFQLMLGKQLAGSLIRKQKLFREAPDNPESKAIHKLYLEIEIYKSLILFIKAKHQFKWIQNEEDVKDLKKYILLVRKCHQEIDRIKMEGITYEQGNSDIR